MSQYVGGVWHPRPKSVTDEPSHETPKQMDKDEIARLKIEEMELNSAILSICSFSGGNESATTGPVVKTEESDEEQGGDEGVIDLDEYDETQDDKVYSGKVSDTRENGAIKINSLIHNGSALMQLRVNEEDIFKDMETMSGSFVSKCDQILRVEMGNSWGRVLTKRPVISKYEYLIMTSLKEWSVWCSNSYLKGPPLMYKCYVCERAWWHLGPFREHLSDHGTSNLVTHLETNLHECNIIVADSDRPATVKEFQIDSNCWKCGKDFQFHRASEKYLGMYYKCRFCNEKCFTCVDMNHHLVFCGGYRSHVLATSQHKVRFETNMCYICRTFAANAQGLKTHFADCHMVRSDWPTLTANRICLMCDAYYLDMNFHYCPKTRHLPKLNCKACLKSFPNKYLYDMHSKIYSGQTFCDICGKTVHSKCKFISHLVKHSTNFLLLERCSICVDNLLFFNEASLNKHLTRWHQDKIGKKWTTMDTVLIPKMAIKAHMIEKMDIRAGYYSSTAAEGSSSSTMGTESGSKKRGRKKNIIVREIYGNNTDVPYSEDCLVLSDEDISNGGKELHGNTEELNSGVKVAVKMECHDDDDENDCVVISNEEDTSDDDALVRTEKDIDENPSDNLAIVKTEVDESLADNEANSKEEVDSTDLMDTKAKDDDEEEDTVDGSLVKEEVDAADQMDTKGNDDDDEEEDTVYSSLVKEEVNGADLMDTEANDNIEEEDAVDSSLVNAEVGGADLMDTNADDDEEEDDDAASKGPTNGAADVENAVNDEDAQFLIIKTESDDEDFAEDLIIMNNAIATVEYLDEDNSYENVLSTVFGGKPLAGSSAPLEGEGEGGSQQAPAKETKPDVITLSTSLNLYRCTKCHSKYVSMEDYVQHFAIHGYIQRCPECAIDVPRDTYTEHIQRHIRDSYNRVDGGDLYVCKVCDEAVDVSLVFGHWEAHLQLDCDSIADELIEMNKNFKSMSEELLMKVIERLLCKVEVATKRKERQEVVVRYCMVCNRQCSKWNDEKRHLADHLLHHAMERYKENKDWLKCPVCGKLMKSSHAFRLHMRSHGSSRVYKCKLCGKVFSELSDYVKHKESHERQCFICDYCETKFYTKTEIVSHIMMHRNLGTTQCNCCGKRFLDCPVYRRRLRRRNRRRRKKAKGYGCKVCTGRFDSFKSLWDHQWDAHNVRVVEADCPICYKPFRRLMDVKHHMSTEHNKHTTPSDSKMLKLFFERRRKEKEVILIL